MDSTCKICGNEKYSQNKTHKDDIHITPERAKLFRKHAKELNAIGDGDQAAFIFEKTR